MSWLKRMLGLAAPTPSAAEVTVSRPLDLDNGKSVVVDPSLKLVLEGKVHQPLLEGHHTLWSSGVISLGESNFLNRFYFEDGDNWIQVHTTGAEDGQVESVILFYYASAKVVNTESELARLAGPESDIGNPKIVFEGQVFEREWGTEEGQTALVQYDEKVVSPEGQYRMKHHAMLYARDTALPNRREFLLFSVEENEEGVVTLTASTGVSLYTTDITVTF